MKHGAFLGAAIAALVVASANAGTIVNGNASMNLIGIPVFSSGLGDGTLLTDPNTVDQLYKYCWYYRTPNNNQNRLFSSLDTPSEVIVGNTDTVTYNNAGPGPAGMERFNAVFTIQLFDGSAPNTIDVLTRLVFSNPNPVTVTYQVFNIVDLDLSGTATDDRVSITDSNGVRALQTESSPSTNYAEVLGVGASKFEVNTGTNLRNKLNGGAFDLANTVGPVSGDVAVACQWTLTLAPEASATIASSYSINKSAISAPPCPGDLNGDRVIDLSDLAILLSHFGETNASPELGDLNGDGIIDLSDLAGILAQYGAACS